MFAHLYGLMHVAGDVREDGHSWQRHQHRSDHVTGNPAGDGPEEGPGALQNHIQIKRSST